MTTRTINKITYISISIVGVAIVGIIGFVIIAFSVNSKHDKKIVDAMTQEFQLPANYKLLDSKYDNQHCLDVCAHRVLTYSTNDDQTTTNVTIINEIAALGYRYNHEAFYTKEYKGKTVHVDVLDTKPGHIRIDLSL